MDRNNNNRIKNSISKTIHLIQICIDLTGHFTIMRTLVSDKFSVRVFGFAMFAINVHWTHTVFTSVLSYFTSQNYAQQYLLEYFRFGRRSDDFCVVSKNESDWLTDWLYVPMHTVLCITKCSAFYVYITFSPSVLSMCICQMLCAYNVSVCVRAYAKTRAELPTAMTRVASGIRRQHVLQLVVVHEIVLYKLPILR